MSNNKLKHLILDIRFWIFIFFILRLFNINSPIFDSHHWRQADGYSIARNFFEIDANILYPRIDHAGQYSGIMGSEFPIMNYVVHWLYHIFSIDWWQGRLVNLIVSSIGCWYFYKIINNYINKEISFNATLFLIVSIWFAHSRKFMPDVFSTSLVIIGVYYGWRYLKDNKGHLYLILFGAFISIGILSKLPAFLMTTLLFPAIVDKNVHLKRKIYLVAISILSALPVIWWYFYWAPKLTQDYGYYYFFMGASINESIQFLINEWQNTFSRFYVDAMQYIGFIFYILGVFFVFKHKNKTLLSILILGSLLQLIFMLKGGETFAHHSYYIIPFVPIMVLFASYFILQVKLKWLKYILVLSVLIEGIANQQHDLMPKQSKEYMLNFEKIANLYTLKNDLIAINNNIDPTALYFTHRKGWSLNSKNLIKDNKLKELLDNNCKLIIWDKHRATKPNKLIYFYLIKEDNDFAVYKSK